MIATLKLPRIGRDSEAPARPKLPETERERGQLWGDVVLEAVLALRNQLTSRDQDIVAAAANSILELERTRMRHDICVSGTRTGTCGMDEIGPGDAETQSVEGEESAVVQFDEGDTAALSEHIGEIRAHMAKVVRRSMGGIEAKTYVVEKLDRWQIRPSQIRRGEFVQMLGLMKELPAAESAQP